MRKRQSTSKGKSVSNEGGGRKEDSTFERPNQARQAACCDGDLSRHKNPKWWGEPIGAGEGIIRG